MKLNIFKLITITILLFQASMFCAAEKESIFDAIHAHDLDKVKKILAENPKAINEVNARFNEKPIHVATSLALQNSYYKHEIAFEIFKELLKQRTNIDDASDDIGWSPLTHSIIFLDDKIVQYLLDQGADLDILDNDGNDIKAKCENFETIEQDLLKQYKMIEEAEKHPNVIKMRKAKGEAIKQDLLEVTELPAEVAEIIVQYAVKNGTR